jgi:hypothetical protein
MKTVKILTLTLISSFVLFSCKNSEKQNSKVESILENDLAITESDNSKEIISDNYLYVTAFTGLSLREYANLQSEKLTVMPYGTKVKVIIAEENPTMIIDEIKGGMNEIEFNHKKGYAFNGFLSKIFPPENDISAKGYAEDLKIHFSSVVFTESTGGTASRPTNTESLFLPTEKWHEAFYIAQQLFEFPKEFKYPSQKGKDFQIITDRKIKRDKWLSELHISRKKDALTKIEYVYKTKGFSKLVAITKEDNGMRISKTEIVE